MKNKKLLILLIVLAVLVVVILVFARIFAVSSGWSVCHNFDGGQVLIANSPDDKDVLDACKGESIIFLSKNALSDKLSQQFPDWYVVGIVKHFPSIVEVHFVQKVPVFQVNIDGMDYYLDTFGTRMENAEGNLLDISSAFTAGNNLNIVEKSFGKKLTFADEEMNKRLEAIRESVMALWQCKIEIEDIPQVLGKANVFEFDNSGKLIINTLSHSRFVIDSYENDLTNRLIKAFGVYYNDKVNLQREGIVITVGQNGVPVSSEEGNK